jgi:hypothetical protein
MADSDVILNDYRSSIKEINRLFLVGLFFTLAAHFYVVEPYFQLKIREQSLQNSLPAMEQSINVLGQEATKINEAKQSASAALQEIREDLLRFPDQLRDALPDIQSALNPANNPLPGGQYSNSVLYGQYAQQQYMQQPLPGRTIILPAEITTFEAAVNWYVNDWFAKLLAELENRVVKPVGELGSTNGAGDLDEICKNAVDTVKKTINAVDPDFWHSYGGRGGKMDVASTIRDNIESSFAPLENRVYQLLEETNRQRQGQEEKLAGFNKTIAATRDKIAFLSDRLKSIESPFGPLPLRLTDLIKLFPFLLAALAVKLAFVMRQAAAQQALFKQLTAAGPADATSQLLLQYQLRSFLLAPAGRLLSLAAMSAWLTVLFAVFIRSVWLMSIHPQIFIDGGEQEALFMNPQLYHTGCLAGLALLAGAAAFMLKICWRPSEGAAKTGSNRAIKSDIKEKR